MDESDLEAQNTETTRILTAAGWHPNRKIPTTAWRTELESSGFTWTSTAETFLSEFGGLVVNQHGPGISVAREAFEFDPTLAIGEEDRFEGWAEVLGESLFPIGELDRGRFFLGISGSGGIYLVETWLAFFGVGWEGLRGLVNGVKPRELELSMK